MEWKQYLRLLAILLLLYSFYAAGFPAYYIPVMGVIFILLIFLKGSLYNKIDSFLIKRFPFIGKLPSWAKKLLIIAVFISIYVLIKQIVFAFLKIVGIDIEKTILENISVRR